MYMLLTRVIYCYYRSFSYSVVIFTVREWSFSNGYCDDRFVTTDTRPDHCCITQVIKQQLGDSRRFKTFSVSLDTSIEYQNLLSSTRSESEPVELSLNSSENHRFFTALQHNFSQ